MDLGMWVGYGYLPLEKFFKQNEPYQEELDIRWFIDTEDYEE